MALEQALKMGPALVKCQMSSGFVQGHGQTKTDTHLPNCVQVLSHSFIFVVQEKQEIGPAIYLNKQTWISVYQAKQFVQL